MTIRENLKKIKFATRGIATYLPHAVAQFLPEHQVQFSGGGVREYHGAKEVARSCYSVWMRYVVAGRQLGASSSLIDARCVGEIGPGDSVGVGLAMLLSGATHYFAFDVVPTASNFENKVILEELIKLFKERAPIPGDDEFPKTRPRLASYEFPRDIFTEEKLGLLLRDARLNEIRSALEDFLANKPPADDTEISINYYAPWYGAEALTQLRGRLDLVVSCAALEHVDDIGKLYDALALIIKGGGVMVHAIDFKSHGTSGAWNGYWAYSATLWKIVRGRCMYLINREPYSSHISEISKNFLVIGSMNTSSANTLLRSDLAKEFTNLTEEDLVTSDAFIVAQKI